MSYSTRFGHNIHVEKPTFEQWLSELSARYRKRIGISRERGHLTNDKCRNYFSRNLTPDRAIDCEVKQYGLIDMEVHRGPQATPSDGRNRGQEHQVGRHGRTGSPAEGTTVSTQ